MNLSELIDTHRGGRSYAELERDCGGSPSKGRLQQMVRQPIKNFPDPPTVRALARGLKVSQAAVVLAAAESLGLDVRTSRPRVVELMPADADHLSERQAAAIAHLVATMVEPAEDEPGYVPGAGNPSKGTEPDFFFVARAKRKAAVEEQGRLFGGRWDEALRNAIDSSDVSLAVIVPDLLERAVEAGASGDLVEQSLSLVEAARKGAPSLAAARHQQDQAGEAPDPEGPEHGA